MATSLSAASLLPSPAPSFDDPIGVLVACHERMRRQLGTLARLPAHVNNRGVDAEARSAAQAVLRYFDRAGADHHADEDDSVLPRVLARAPDLAPLIAQLYDDHAVLQRRWRKLRPLLGGDCEPRYVGRAPSASTATGSHTIHQMEQKRIVEEALG